MPAVLSIQSSVSYGHVGNAAAVFCLRRLGVDAWPVDTVAFSNHPGHGGFRGTARPAGELAALVEGLDALGVLSRCDAVLSGYLGTAAAGAVVLDAVSRTKAANPGALYVCDPVMGDRDTGLYVAEDLIAFFHDRALPAADLIVPNPFELEVLSRHPTGDVPTALAAADVVMARGPAMVLVTSVPVAAAGGAAIGNLLLTRDGAWLATTPRLPTEARGAGDTVAALFLGRLLTGAPPVEALSLAVASVFSVLEMTVAAGSADLRLIAAQDALTQPTTEVSVDQVRPQVALMR